MYKFLNSLSITTLVIFSSCQNKTDSLEPTITKDSLIVAEKQVETIEELQEVDLIGKYTGEIPCKNCDYSELWYEFSTNKKFTLSELSLDKPLEPKTKNGVWKFDTQNKIVTLKIDKTDDVKFRLTPTGKLIQLDKDNKDLSKEDSDYYVFTKIKK